MHPPSNAITNFEPPTTSSTTTNKRQRRRSTVLSIYEMRDLKEESSFSTDDYYRTKCNQKPTLNVRTMQTNEEVCTVLYAVRTLGTRIYRVMYCFAAGGSISMSFKVHLLTLYPQQQRGYEERRLLHYFQWLLLQLKNSAGISLRWCVCTV